MPGPPTPYPGVNPPTISTTPGAGGVSGGVLTVVNDGSHGRYTIPSTVNGNNDRTAGNLAAAPQAEQDTHNWEVWRIPDWINGGDYSSAYTGSVFMGGNLIFKGGVNTGVLITNNSGLLIGHSLYGPGLLVVETNGTLQMNVGSIANVNTETTTGFTVTSNGSVGQAIHAVGVSSDVGLKAEAGASQISAVWAHNGCLTVDKSLPTPATNPGSLSNFFQNQIPRAFAQVVVNSGGPTITVGGQGFNVASAAFSDPGGGHYGAIEVTLVLSMSSATDYVILMPSVLDAGGGVWLPVPIIIDAAHFKWRLAGAVGGGVSPQNIDTLTITYMFAVFGS